MTTSTKEINISTLIPESFHDVWRATFDPAILNIVCKGGRGSGKSSDIAHIIVQLLMRYPVNAVGIRKTDNTIELSIFEQIKWAISEQKVSHLFKVNKSPMRITYTPRGNFIAFRGAMEPERIKSLKDANFPFAIGWLEEIVEFKTEDEITTITNSLLRGELDDGLFYKFFYSYNPAKRKNHFLNKKYESAFIASNTFVHHSTYLDNPFISKQFIEEAEATRERNERKYKHEYLGEAIGSGVVPFDNLEFREITDEEVATFDNIRQGIDFGYSVDPFSFGRWHYDKKRRTLYAIDEIYRIKLSNREAAEIIIEKGYNDFPIIADSAEPKSIDEMRTFGLRVKGAKKGPGSIEYGEKWLDDLDAIVIDPKRTPKTAAEFENIDYKTDKDGNVIPKLEEQNQHTIDQVRYAMERDMKRPSIRVLT